MLSLLGKVTVVNSGQLSKAPDPIVLILSDITTLVNDVPLNAFWSISTTLKFILSFVVATLGILNSTFAVGAM